jgi:DeoR family transcriptional regulator, fructose operon transcriptional repressor
MITYSNINPYSINIFLISERDYMFSEERQQKIAEMLQEKASIKVNELAVIFSVSESTIRRDLREMEENGLLSRTHGGAVGLTTTSFEPTFREKEDEKHDEKVLIGSLAVSLIEDGDTIILDSGTTTLEIAKRITSKGITVITNSIDIAAVLSNKDDIELIVTGGSLRFTTRAMVGHITENVLSNFRVDKAFIGANGISISQGITTPNLTEAHTKKAMMNVAGKVFIVADSSKFNNVCFSVICPADKVSAIITSSDLDSDTVKEFEAEGIEILMNK